MCVRASLPVCVLGAVSLAGAQSNLWAVEGGNKLVCSGLLKLAKANLVQAQVKTISPQTNGTTGQCSYQSWKVCVGEKKVRKSNNESGDRTLNPLVFILCVCVCVCACICTACIPQERASNTS